MWLARNPLINFAQMGSADKGATYERIIVIDGTLQLRHLLPVNECLLFTRRYRTIKKSRDIRVGQTDDPRELVSNGSPQRRRGSAVTVIIRVALPCWHGNIAGRYTATIYCPPGKIVCFDRLDYDMSVCGRSANPQCLLASRRSALKTV